MRRPAKTTPLEALTSSELAQLAVVESFTKQDLVRFCNSFVGGSWSHLRSLSKSELAIKIQDYARK